MGRVIDAKALFKAENGRKGDAKSQPPDNHCEKTGSLHRLARASERAFLNEAERVFRSACALKRRSDILLRESEALLEDIRRATPDFNQEGKKSS